MFLRNLVAAFALGLGFTSLVVLVVAVIYEDSPSCKINSPVRLVTGCKSP
jgi:hypothetical protein